MMNLKFPKFAQDVIWCASQTRREAGPSTCIAKGRAGGKSFQGVKSWTRHGSLPTGLKDHEKTLWFPPGTSQRVAKANGGPRCSELGDANLFAGKKQSSPNHELKSWLGSKMIDAPKIYQNGNDLWWSLIKFFWPLMFMVERTATLWGLGLSLVLVCSGFQLYDTDSRQTTRSGGRGERGRRGGGRGGRGRGGRGEWWGIRWRWRGRKWGGKGRWW